MRATRTIPTLLVVAALAALWSVAVYASDDATKPIAAAELAQRLKDGSAPTILDVRTPKEYAEGHIPGAVNIPYDQLADRLGDVPAGPDDEVVVHCYSGKRAAIAEDVLRKSGYTKVRDLEGHWKGWSDAHLPTE